MEKLEQYSFSAEENLRLEQELAEERKQREHRAQYLAATSRVASATPDSPPDQTDLGIAGTAGDVLKGFGNGVAGFAQSLVGMADGAAELFGGDLVDDEVYKKNVFGEQRTFLGGLAKGLTQFALGLASGNMLIGAASKGIGALAAGTTAGTIARGAAADLIAFGGTEERLSNLIQDTPLANPVTDYLSAKEGDDELLGRVKNVAEGLLVGVAFKGIGHVFGEGLKHFKAAKSGSPLPANAGLMEEAKQVAAANVATLTQNTLTGLQAMTKGLLKQTPAQATGHTVLQTVAQAQRLIEPLIEHELTHRNLHTVIGDIATTMETSLRAQAPDLHIPLAQALGPVDRAGMRQVFESMTTGYGALAEELIDMLPAPAQRSVAGAMLAFQSVYHLSLSALRKTARMLATNPTNEDAIRNFKLAKDLAGELSTGFDKWYAKSFSPRDTKGMIDGLLGAVPKDAPPLDLINKNLSVSEYRSKLVTEAQAYALTMDPVGAGSILRKSGTWDKINEWIPNALLGQMPTFTLAFASNVVKLVLTPIEQAAGGLLTGNLKQVRDAGRWVYAVGSSLMESLKWSAESMFRGEGIAVPEAIEGTARGSSDIMGAGRGAIRAGEKWQGTAIGASINLLGELTRVPGRIMTSVDELSKQLHARASLKVRTWDAANELDLFNGGNAAAASDPLWARLTAGRPGGNFAELAAEWIDTKVRQGFDSAGGIVDPFAKQAAMEGSFSTPLNRNTIIGSIGSGMQDMAAHVPFLRVIVPFIRTPVNLLLETMTRLPVLNSFNRQMRTWLDSGDPALVAKAYGRWSTGMGVAVVGLISTANGNITGGGPSDPQLLELKKQTGWQPHSIRVKNPDGTERFIQYSRLDPIGGFLGFMADLGEILFDIPDGVQKEELVGTAFGAFTNLMVNKTYLKGVTDFLEALQSNDGNVIERYVGSTASGAIPGWVRMWNTDPLAREARDLASAIHAKLPGSGGVPAKRNILGEPMQARTGTFNLAFTDDQPVSRDLISAASPFAYSRTVSGDVIAELSSLGHRFTKPSPDEDGLDLRTVRNAEGRVAYDRMLELVGEVRFNGKQIRESLTALVKSESYQTAKRADPTGETAARMVTRLMSAYRTVARREAYKEFPAIRAHVEARRTALNEGFARENQRRRSAMGLDDFVRSLQ